MLPAVSKIRLSRGQDYRCPGARARIVYGIAPRGDDPPGGRWGGGGSSERRDAKTGRPTLALDIHSGLWSWERPTLELVSVALISSDLFFPPRPLGAAAAHLYSWPRRNLYSEFEGGHGVTDHGRKYPFRCKGGTRIRHSWPPRSLVYSAAIGTGWIR